MSVKRNRMNTYPVGFSFLRDDGASGVGRAGGLVGGVLNLGPGLGGVSGVRDRDCLFKPQPQQRLTVVIY